jgi:archaellum component FlaG (FlaF/FlaG flagellin family)
LRNHWLNAVGAALSDHPLEKGTSNSGAYRGAPLHYFRKGGTITPPFSKGRLGGIFLRMNSKGLSVLFLVFAMLLMVTIGYVFSYLIPTKQKSIIFPIHSNQAFFIAQSGVEFAVRYALSQTPAWTTPSQLVGLTGVTRNLGSGRFILTYNDTNNTLTSVGEVPTGTERRRISVSNFTSFLQVLILDPDSPSPYWFNPRTVARFYIKNIGSSSLTLTAFSASWDEPPNRQLTSITMTLGATTNTVFTGTYDSGFRNFTPAGNSQAIGPNQVIRIDVGWNQNISPNNSINIYFYDTNGNMYTFTFLI